MLFISFFRSAIIAFFLLILPLISIQYKVVKFSRPKVSRDPHARDHIHPRKVLLHEGNIILIWLSTSFVPYINSEIFLNFCPFWNSPPPPHTRKPDTSQHSCHQLFSLEEYLRGKAQPPAQKLICSIITIEVPITKAPLRCLMVLST